MRASRFFRIASVLLLLFAVGHTLGFREADPGWGVAPVLLAMRSVHFDVQGFHRTYWDFFLGSGFFVSAFLLFAAALAWQLARLPPQTLVLLRSATWAFALCFAALTILACTYFFLIPIVFASLITACLVAAAWCSRN